MPAVEAGLQRGTLIKQHAESFGNLKSEWSEWGERHGRQRREVAVECGGRCRDTNHRSDILFKNKDDQFRTGVYASTVGTPNV